MAILIKNDDFLLKLERPGERYTGSRFDWNGLVSSVRFRDIELLGQEKPWFQRNPSRFGRGLHNEFGIKQAVGYQDCHAGEWFPKIGTGWLKKDENPYFFYNDYELDPLSFQDSTDGQDTVIFSCDSGERNGYAYRYTKRVTLSADGFTITYTLENTGSKRIETDEYVHNFLSLGGKRMGPGYTLEFPWNIEEVILVEQVDPDNILKLSGNTVTFAGRARNQFYLGGLTGGETAVDGVAAQWRLENSGLFIAETGNFTPDAVHLWGWKHVISPEVFFAFSLEPGESVSWERVYTAGFATSSI